MFLFYLVLIGLVVTGAITYVFFPRWSIHRGGGGGIFEGFDPRFEGFDSIFPERVGSEKRIGETAGPDLPGLSCPNLLIQHGTYLMLYRDSMLVERFSSLDEYIDYVDRGADQEDSVSTVDAHGNPVEATRCPVLFLTPETTARGEDLYREQPDPYLLRKGNGIKQESERHVGGFDAHGYEVTKDLVTKDPIPAISDNPMATNWGGVIYSQQAIDSGKYDRRTVGKPTADPGTGDLPVI